MPYQLGYSPICHVQKNYNILKYKISSTNQIASNYTEVVWREAKEYHLGTHHAHKEVAMCNSGGYGTTFGIYYDGSPRYSKMESAENWEVHRDSPFTLYNPDFSYNPTKKKNVCWYDDLENYFEDLKKRTEVNI